MVPRMGFYRVLMMVALGVFLCAPFQSKAMAASDPSVSLDNPAAAIAGIAPAASEEQTPRKDEGGGLPQLKVETYPSQIFWLLLCFGILYVVFSRSTLPAIGSVIVAREDQIKGDLAHAQQAKDTAQAMMVQYQKSLEMARAESLKHLQGVEGDAKKKAAQAADTFRKKSEEQVDAAQQRLNAEIDKAMQDMTAIAADVSILAAQKITGVDADVQKARAIVETLKEKAKAA